MSLTMPLDLIAHDPGRPSYRPYHRYSSEKSATGTSLDRQAGRDDTSDEAVAASLGLPLGPPMVAKAVSAFRGKNVKEGVMAKYLEDLDQGRVPKGEIIGIDEWSRLTRMPLSRSSKLLTDIVDMGGGIYVKKHRALITRTKIDSETGVMDLAMALIHLKIAHEESATKARYNRIAINQRHEDEANGGAIRTKGTVSWLGVTGGSYKDALLSGTKREYFEIADRCHVIRTIFPMALDVGILTISNWLNEQVAAGDTRYLPFGATRKNGSAGWYPASVADLLHNPAVYGLVQRTQIDPETGETRRTPEKDYLGYREIISKDLYDEVQAKIEGRRDVDPNKLGIRAGKGGRKGLGAPNLFSTLCVCDVCGGPVTLYSARPGVPKGRGPRTKTVFKYLRCRTAKLGGACKAAAMPYEWVENGVLGELGDMAIEALSEPKPGPSPAQQEQDRLVKRLMQITADLDRVLKLDNPNALLLMQDKLGEWGNEKRQINTRMEELRLILDREHGEDGAGERLMTIKRLRPLLTGKDGPERTKARTAVYPVMLNAIDRVLVRADKVARATIRGTPYWIDCSKEGTATNFPAASDGFEADRAALAATKPAAVPEFDKGRKLVSRGRMPMRKAGRGR